MKFFILFIILLLIKDSISLVVKHDLNKNPWIVYHMTAAFGPQQPVQETGPFILADPIKACEPLNNNNVSYQNSIVMVYRGDCRFVDKILNAQNVGAVGVVVGNNDYESEFPLIRMAPPDDFNMSSIIIPSINIAVIDYLFLKDHMEESLYYFNATIDLRGEIEFPELIAPLYALLAFVVLLFPMILIFIGLVYIIRWRCVAFRERVVRTARTHRIPLIRYPSHDGMECYSSEELKNQTNLTTVQQPSYHDLGPRTILNHTCAICLEEFVSGEDLKLLHCHHGFHPACIDPWLSDRSDLCPICKRSVLQAIPNTNRRNRIVDRCSWLFPSWCYCSRYDHYPCMCFFSCCSEERRENEDNNELHSPHHRMVSEESRVEDSSALLVENRNSRDLETNIHQQPWLTS